jgi:hypothetical protein
MPSPQILPFKRLRSRFPDTLQTVKQEIQRLTKEDLFARRHVQEVTHESERIRTSLVHATAALNIIEGEAISEDEELVIPRVLYCDEDMPSTSKSRTNGSVPPPSPPSAVVTIPPPCVITPRKSE